MNNKTSSIMAVAALAAILVVGATVAVSGIPSADARITVKNVKTGDGGRGGNANGGDGTIVQDASANVKQSNKANGGGNTKQSNKQDDKNDFSDQTNKNTAIGNDGQDNKCDDDCNSGQLNNAKAEGGDNKNYGDAKGGDGGHAGDGGNGGDVNVGNEED
jgi:hypothetical protein